MQEETQMIRIIALIADQLSAWRGRSEQRGCGFDVGNVPACQQEGVRAATLVDEGVDFRRAAAAGTADGLVLRPLLRPSPRRPA
jgi:hypothetical protein